MCSDENFDDYLALLNIGKSNLRSYRQSCSPMPLTLQSKMPEYLDNFMEDRVLPSVSPGV